MTNRLFVSFLTLILFSVSVTLIPGCGDGGTDPVNPPVITEFSAVPSDIVPGDSSLLTYAVTGADSTKLFPPGDRLTPASSGSLWVSPPMPATYTLVAYNKDGRDSAQVDITMSAYVPSFVQFDLSEDTVVIGHSSVLTWKATQSDSIVFSTGTTATTDSGQVTLDLSTTTVIRAIAYNAVATDTALTTLTVEVPDSLVAVNGLYYRSVMGGNTQTPQIALRVIDDLGGVLRKPWIHLTIVEGDGALSADSIQPGGTELATVNYLFTGALGHALIRASVPGVDSVDLKVRASVLVTGAQGQIQYVYFADSADTYADVIGFNGLPDRVDYTNLYGFPVAIAVYEANLALDFVIWDSAFPPNTVQGHEPVLGGFVIDSAGITHPRTSDSIGIGSTIAEVRAIYGTEEATWYDPAIPPAQVFNYGSQGLTFWTTVTGDSVVFQMDVLRVDTSPDTSGAAPLRMGRP
ncbi:MAG: hypothetical protein KKA42_08670 [candidate division Zixibacteria bacterium]|nr:hypothetical protein [candidate division Zixibacteria bacterium]